MKKFEGILICTDLDGTLFKKDKSVSKENKEAIEYFKSQGGLFTFITGRMPCISTFVCDVINPNCPFGCINGGGVYDREKGYLWKQELSKDAYHLIDYVSEKMPHIGIQINLFDSIYYFRDNPAMERFRRITNTSFIEKDFHTETEPIAKIVFADLNEENIESVQNLLLSHPMADRFDFIRSERTLFEILPKDIGKEVALAKLADIMNVDRKRTVAIGDYNNDIGMIKYAGVGVAVANARDEVKEVADYITVSNEEDAIAAIIRDIDTGKIKV